MPKKSIQWDDPRITSDDIAKMFESVPQDEEFTDTTLPQVTQAMAQRIMDALCANGHGDFLLIQDDEIREWWQAVLKKRKKDARREAQMRRRIEIRQRALNKLTDEERRVLGLNR